MSNRHGPNSWDAYLAVHERRINDFRGHFIVDDQLTHTRTARLVQWEGALICAGGIEIHVRKTQRAWPREGRTWVQTIDYSYQVLRREGASVVNVFRYDNAAHHEHPDAHHRHSYDPVGHEVLPVRHIGAAGWPTLGDVIEEAFDSWTSALTR